MITIPTSTASNDNAPVMPQVSDEFLMMAAAQMHSEGRLVQPQGHWQVGPQDEPQQLDVTRGIYNKLHPSKPKVPNWDEGDPV